MGGEEMASRPHGGKSDGEKHRRPGAQGCAEMTRLDAELGDGWMERRQWCVFSPGLNDAYIERHSRHGGWMDGRQHEQSLPVSLGRVGSLRLHELAAVVAELVAVLDRQGAGVAFRLRSAHGRHAAGGHTGLRGGHGKRHGLTADATRKRGCLQADEQQEQQRPDASMVCGTLHGTKLADAWMRSGVAGCMSHQERPARRWRAFLYCCVIRRPASSASSLSSCTTGSLEDRAARGRSSSLACSSAVLRSGLRGCVIAKF